MKKISCTKGFSLIELMVVIAIIAILKAIITSNLAQSKAKARDSKRISDIAQLQLALELFFDRCNGYPPDINLNSTISSCPNDPVTNQPVTFGYFIGKIPVGPNANENYYYSTPGSPYGDYVLHTNLESENNPALKESAPSSLAAECLPYPANGQSYCVSPK